MKFFSFCKYVAVKVILAILTLPPARQIFGRKHSSGLRMIIGLLAHPAEEVRGEAMKALKKIGAIAVRPLAVCFAERPALRARIASAIREIDDPEAISDLKGIIMDPCCPDVQLRKAATYALCALYTPGRIKTDCLSWIGKEAIPWFLAAIEHAPHLESNVAQVIRGISNTETLAEVGALLTNRYEQIRKAAASAICGLPLAELRRVLLYITLARAQQPVRAAHLASTALVDVLLGVDEGRKSNAAHALGLIGDGRVVESLVRVLQDATEPLRSATALVLAQLGYHREISCLVDLAGNFVGAKGPALSNQINVSEVNASPPFCTLQANLTAGDVAVLRFILVQTKLSRVPRRADLAWTSPEGFAEYRDVIEALKQNPAEFSDTALNFLSALEKRLVIKSSGGGSGFGGMGLSRLRIYVDDFDCQELNELAFAELLRRRRSQLGIQ